MRFIKNHPLLSATIGLLAAGVPWLQSGWALVSNEPLFEVVARNIGPLPLANWLAISAGAAGLAVLGLLVYQLTKSRRRAIVTSLVTLREFAVHTLLNRVVANDADLQQLKRDIDLWQNAVLKQLDDFGSPSDVTYFRVLGTYTSKNLPGGNPDHAKEKNMLAERIDRLLGIMRRIEGE